MKNFKLPLCIFLIAAMALVTLTACGSSDSEASSVASEAAGDGVNQPNPDDSAASEEYIDENGFFIGITALDHVELFEYDAVTIPTDAHSVTDEEVQEEIEYILSGYSSTVEVTDRAIEDGDTINMDFVGTVNGVEFEGGNTEGMGVEATIGVSEYIDDFLEQLIGRVPGETIDIEVTFPDDYGVDELDGQDAVFAITINHIVLTVDQELTDDFVAETFADYYGYTTAQEMWDGIYASMQEYAIQTYVQDLIINGTTINSIPDRLMEYLEDEMISYFVEAAEAYEMELEDYLLSSNGLSSIDELVESYYDYNVETATYYLVMQAIAEDAGITVSDGDVADYFLEYVGTDDYSEYEEQYGMPYLKQSVLTQQVFDRIVENATLA